MRIRVWFTNSNWSGAYLEYDDVADTQWDDKQLVLTYSDGLKTYVERAGIQAVTELPERPRVAGPPARPARGSSTATG